jgi:outer membrane protein OmpA-like peptidoglycan-associated protein
MPRPIRKGAISFGLVTIPVNLYSAVERREALSFNLLHKKDHARIQNKRFCSDENVEVPWHDIVKGYEYAKNQYVVVTDEDFEKARVPATQTFDICAFVPAGEVADLYFDEPYYLEPNGKSGVKAYVEPSGEALVLSMMRFAHESRSPSDLDLPNAGAGRRRRWSSRIRLIDTLADKGRRQGARESRWPNREQFTEASGRTAGGVGQTCSVRAAATQSAGIDRRHEGGRMGLSRAMLILCTSVSIFAAACATKSFVQNQLGATEARIGRNFERQDAKLREADERASASRQEIDAADQRIQGLDARVNQLDTAASEAQNRADQAAGVARDAEARLAQRIADRNKYRLLGTRFIHFESGRSDIRDAGVSELEEVAKALQADPNAIVELQGFADPRGSDRYNDQLARERVEVVVRHLVRHHGIELRQIRSIAMGKAALAAGETPTNEVLANARRVEIRLIAPWSSWEDTHARDDAATSWPSASIAEPVEPVKGFTASQTDQDRSDDAEFTPERARTLLRVLENRRQLPPGSSTYP